MRVPAEIRSAALAAFDQRRPGVVVLGLVDDSCTGIMQLRNSLPPGVTRVLAFASADLLVRVEVLEAEQQEQAATLRVRSTPVHDLFVEVLSPRGGVHLRWGPGEPLDVTAPATGPVSLLLSREDEADGERPWQTTWVTL